MVQFDEKKSQYTVTLNGDRSEFFATLKALSRLIAAADPELVTRENMYRVAILIEEMLPEE